MKKISVTSRLTFYGSLIDFLGPGPTPRSVEFTPLTHSQLKDTIESYEVPHCEVDQLLLNGQPIGFHERAHPADYIDVFPADVQTGLASLVRPPELTDLRFVIDCNLGKLNSMMRSLGFDCYYKNHIPDSRAASISAEQNRFLLTKDRRMLKRSIIQYGYYVRSSEPAAQVREVLARFKLAAKVKLLSRCIGCNTPTVPVEKSKILDRLEPLTKKYYDKFYMCPECQKIYWQGSHYEKIRAWRDSLST